MSFPMKIAVQQILAEKAGDVAEARRLADELDKRGLPDAETLIRHRHKEREEDRLIPMVHKGVIFVGFEPVTTTSN